MANYLTTHYKGKYRILPELCEDTNDFPRDENGGIDEDTGVYITCQYGSKIWYWGLNESRRAVLGAYIPSLGRGRNIKKAMKKEKINFFNYDESDEEVIFFFPATEIEKIAELIKPKTSGANISPFSNRNLPKADVEIPIEKIEEYKKISSRVGKSDMLVIKNANNAFLSDILEKTLKKQLKDKKFSYKEDMRKLKMSRQVKEYIYVKNMFDDYLNYLDNAVTEYYNNKV